MEVIGTPSREAMTESIVNNMDNWDKEEILKFAKTMMRKDLSFRSETDIFNIYNSSNASKGGGNCI